MQFIPCQDKCTYDGSHCEGCGRSHDEIKDTKKLVKSLLDFVQSHGYTNGEQFIETIAQSAVKKLRRQAQ